MSIMDSFNGKSNLNRSNLDDHVSRELSAESSENDQHQVDHCFKK